MVINNSKSSRCSARGSKYIKFGSNLCTNRTNVTTPSRGDYEATCEKVQGGNVRETATMTKQVQVLGYLESSGSAL